MLTIKYATTTPEGDLKYTITTCNEIEETQFVSGCRQVKFTTFPVGICGGESTYESSVYLEKDGPTCFVFVENMAGKVVQKFSAQQS